MDGRRWRDEHHQHRPTTAADIEHARKRAAPGAACELVMGPVVAVSDRSELASHAVRQLIGWYLTGMGPLYGDHLVAQGHGDAVDALRMDNPRPRPGCIVWPDAADPLLDELGVYGHADEVATAMRSWDGRVDVVTVTTGPATPADLNLLLEACAPPAAAPLSAGVAPTILAPRTDDADL
jgi:hypothetical protein